MKLTVSVPFGFPLFSLSMVHYWLEENTLDTLGKQVKRMIQVMIIIVIMKVKNSGTINLKRNHRTTRRLEW